MKKLLKNQLKELKIQPETHILPINTDFYLEVTMKLYKETSSSNNNRFTTYIQKLKWK